ncbi:MAG: hypothetical protein MN733_37315 [Nitrososphaera sp.]|nr:hypothetical protein [Nitrososphaera sp.]
MRRGFVAITTVLVISAVAVATVSTAMLLGVGEMLASFAGMEGQESLQLVEGCVEDALIKIHANSAWAGGTLNRPEGSCTVTINSPNPNWNITVTTTSGDFQRKVQVVFTRGTSLVITSWEEI